MERGTVLELSTAHITEKDNQELHRMSVEAVTSCGAPLNIAEAHYGYFMTVPAGEEEMNETIKLAEREGFGELSDSFWNIMWHAVRNGYRVILLDCDGDIIDGLPEHDW